jgi:hypothetical protein
MNRAVRLERLIAATEKALADLDTEPVSRLRQLRRDVVELRERVRRELKDAHVRGSSAVSPSLLMVLLDLTEQLARG